MKRLLAAILAVLMLCSAAGCTRRSAETEPEDSNAATSHTGQSEQEETEPSKTEPEQTEPETTTPETTEPEVTEPEVTEPEQTEPETTEPETAPTGPEELYTRAELEEMDTTVNGWGLGPSTDGDNRPTDATKAQEKYGQYDAHFIAPANGNIYLTFDEGYENGYTSQILDVLKEKNVKAVFFITMPYAKSQPELVRRMIDEGHVVGNHSVHHKSMPTLSIDQMISEVTDLHEYVLKNFGYEMTLFRPPMGEFSEQSLAVLQSLGYKTVNWSFAYYDYDPENQMDPEKAYNKVVAAAHSGGLYLLHAVSKTNTEILGDVIDELRRLGYTIEVFS